MNKKDKIKNYINLCKEYWKNPRYNALMKLGLWFVFLIFVSFFLRSGLSSQKRYYEQSENNNPLKIFNEMENYNFEYNVTYNLDNLKIKGSNYKNTMLYTIQNDNNIYYADNDKYYRLINDKKIDFKNTLPFNICMIKPKIIYQLIKLGELDYTKENSNQSKEEGYKIKLSDYVRLVEGKQINSDDVITINYLIEDGTITTVGLDLTNYIKLSYSNTIVYKLEINYEVNDSLEPFDVY